MTRHNPQTNLKHAERMIRSMSSQSEVMGYYNQAKLRGLASHEIELLSEKKAELMKIKQWREK